MVHVRVPKAGPKGWDVSRGWLYASGNGLMLPIALPGKTSRRQRERSLNQLIVIIANWKLQWTWIFFY